MSSVVVTGALGRIGQKLTARLSRAGYDVIAIGRPDANSFLHNRPTERGVRVHLVDCLGDPESCQALFSNTSAVIHLACSSNPSISELNLWADIDRNLKGTLRLFELAQRAGVEQFLFPSSGGTIYGAAAQRPTPETALPQPIGLHGSMKLACEQYLTALARRGTTQLKILRIANPYGMSTSAKQQGFIDVALNNLRNNRPVVIWGDGSVRRDYLHIDDLTTAFVAAVNNPGSFTVNVGSGMDHSLHDIVLELGRHFDLTGRIVFEPARSVDVPLSVLDVQLARKLLGWSPEISLPDGIERAVNAV